MKMYKIGVLCLSAVSGSGLAAIAQTAATNESADSGQVEIEEIRVLGRARLFSDAADFSPVSRVDGDTLEQINLSTIEDGLAYEPSLVVRRRFVGDPNGTLGMRGSNMFQGPRTMVFADGLPLHYHLQSRWNGPPRWSLVSPDETEAIDVVYGPFSAEYSGNAMGGVVNIRTRMPEDEIVTVEGSFFSQDYDVLGRDERYNGGRQFLAYGNRWGDASVYAFYNRVSNLSQPMDQFASRTSEAQGDEPAVNGSIPGVDPHEQAVRYFGDSGSEKSVTELYKTKLEYDLGRFTLRATVALEDRSRDLDDKNNFLRDANGQPVWGGVVREGDQRFMVGAPWANPFELQEQERESLLLGLGVNGALGDSGWYLDAFATDFDVRSDELRRSGFHPDDPRHDGRGRVVIHDGTGWQTADLKLSRDDLAGMEGLHFSAGLHFSRYTLGVFDYRSDDYQSGLLSGLNGASGGEMSTRATYLQWRWEFADRWNAGFGLRQEYWEADNGFVDDEVFPARSDSALSPKFSLGYQPAPDWQLRYSIARAVRFPVVEELFQSLNAGRSVQLSNPGLDPEDGLHHNLTMTRDLVDGELRFNLFTEQIDNVIFGQRGIVDGVELNTFLPIDRVRTDGAELVWNQNGLFGTALGLRSNLSYTRAEIRKNVVNPVIEGNDFPRMPRWRANILLDYPLTGDIDISGGFRFADNQYNTLENNDTARHVFGAMDGHRLFNVRARWAATERMTLAMGVDNLTDEETYVHHPWPFRTVFLEASWTH